MIVIDASAAVELVLRTGAPAVEDTVFDDAEGLSAPEILDVEVLSALRRAERRGSLGADRLEQAMADLSVAVPELYPLRALIVRATGLRANISPYDAVYVALAELLDATLLTADARLGRAARSLTAVRVVTSAA